MTVSCITKGRIWVLALNVPCLTSAGGLRGTRRTTRPAHSDQGRQPRTPGACLREMVGASERGIPGRSTDAPVGLVQGRLVVRVAPHTRPLYPVDELISAFVFLDQCLGSVVG